MRFKRELSQNTNETEAILNNQRSGTDLAPSIMHFIEERVSLSLEGRFCRAKPYLQSVVKSGL